MATSRPASSSTNASARSIPVVTAAEDHTEPSRTNIASGTTVTAGWLWASSWACFQCVVARRPSRMPAAASRKLPMQTEHTRGSLVRFSDGPADRTPDPIARASGPRPRGSEAVLAAIVRSSAE